MTIEISGSVLPEKVFIDGIIRIYAVFHQINRAAFFADKIVRREIITVFGGNRAVKIFDKFEITRTNGGKTRVLSEMINGRYGKFIGEIFGAVERIIIVKNSAAVIAVAHFVTIIEIMPDFVRR